jgi:hypothetical protein
MATVELTAGELLNQDVGAGTGGGSIEQVEKLMADQLRTEEYAGRVVVVRYKK